MFKTKSKIILSVALLWSLASAQATASDYSENYFLDGVRGFVTSLFWETEGPQVQVASNLDRTPVYESVILQPMLPLQDLFRKTGGLFSSVYSMPKREVAIAMVNDLKKNPLQRLSLAFLLIGEDKHAVITFMAHRVSTISAVKTYFGLGCDVLASLMKGTSLSDTTMQSLVFLAAAASLVPQAQAEEVLPALASYQEKYNITGCERRIAQVFERAGFEKCLGSGIDLGLCRISLLPSTLDTLRTAEGAEPYVQYVVFARHADGTTSRIEYRNDSPDSFCIQSSHSPSANTALAREVCFKRTGELQHTIRELEIGMDFYQKGMEPGQKAPVVVIGSGQYSCAMLQIRQNLVTSKSLSTTCIHSISNDKRVETLCLNPNAPEQHRFTTPTPEEAARLLEVMKLDNSSASIRSVAVRSNEPWVSVLGTHGSTECPVPVGSYWRSCDSVITQTLDGKCLLKADCLTNLGRLVPAQENLITYEPSEVVYLHNWNGTIRDVTPRSVAFTIETCKLRGNRYTYYSDELGEGLSRFANKPILTMLRLVAECNTEEIYTSERK